MVESNKHSSKRSRRWLCQGLGICLGLAVVLVEAQEEQAADENQVQPSPGSQVEVESQANPRENANSEDGGGAESCRVFIEPGTSAFDISTVPDPMGEEALPPDAVVGDIVYTRLPIFNANDPEENNALFRLADFLHIDTQERIIGQQLLFETGDPINERVIEESARILRDRGYLYDARVWPYRICGNRVDVEVVTREVWTLQGGVSASRSGGAEETSVSLSDDNFLGRGESVAVARTSSRDRSGFEFSYQDPNLFASRHALELFYADNDDGSQTTVDLQRPFYSLDTLYAWGVRYDDYQREDSIYERGEDVAAYQSQVTNVDVFVGLSSGWQDGVTKRWQVGLRSQKEEYSLAEDEVAPDALPENREINYPYIGYESIQEDFIQATNVNQIHRIEDFNLGLSWRWDLGYAAESFGSDRDRIVYSASLREAWRLDETTLLQAELNMRGLWQIEERKTEDFLVEASWRYYDGVSSKSGTYLSLDLRYSKNLPEQTQLLLGAEEGLRGYPDRYQEGDRSFVFTAERRYYTDWHLWRLLRIGGAVFFDVGRAWTPGDPNADATGVLANAGFGLRIASTRAETKRVLHLDFAFPFEHEDDIDGVQILVTGKQSF